MRVRIPPLESSLRTDVSPRLVATAPDLSSRRMPEGLHGLLIPRSRVRIPPGRTYRPVAQRIERETSFQPLVAVTDLFEKKNDARRMPAGLHGSPVRIRPGSGFRSFVRSSAW